MLHLILSSLFILSVSVGFTFACSASDYIVIQSCYSTTLFAPNAFSSNSSTTLKDEMLAIFNDQQRLVNICASYDSLNSCIHANDTSIIARCFDVESAQMFPFDGFDPNNGRRYINNYNELGYICDPKKSWALQKTKCVTDALNVCKFLNPIENSEMEGYLGCVRGVAKNNCNIAMACYAQIFAGHQACYDVADSYQCNSSTSGNDLIKGFCSDDTSDNNNDGTTTTVISSTTTVFSTTTTTTDPSISTTPTSNALQNAFVFVPFLFAFLFTHLFLLNF
uniref:Uncharacterized protein n=1 Tax=Panagrolaimus sp. ES5 TaxID=591445 RepID=A0AC34FPA5_9BILA